MKQILVTFFGFLLTAILTLSLTDSCTSSTCTSKTHWYTLNTQTQDSVEVLCNVKYYLNSCSYADEIDVASLIADNILSEVKNVDSLTLLNNNDSIIKTIKNKSVKEIEKKYPNHKFKINSIKIE